MTTGKYNQVQLGSIYFTKDGLDGGVPCRTEIAGLDVLSLSYTGQTIIALDGTPHIQTITPIRGVPISITVTTMEEAVYQSVRDAINTAIAAATTLTLTITDGAFGDFLLTVYPSFPAITFKGEFQHGRVKDVTFHFTVSVVGYPAEAGALTLAGLDAAFS